MIPEIPKYYTTKERSSLRRSLRIQRRDDRRRCEELERRALEEMRAQAHVPKRLTKQPIKRPTTTSTLSQTSSKRSKKKKVYHDLSQTNTTSRLLSMPLDLLLYLLEFLGIYYFIYHNIIMFIVMLLIIFFYYHHHLPI